MVVGHYATALVAKKHVPEAPLWLFLVASILLDWLLVIFVVAGIEEMKPAADSPSFTKMIVDTTYSHDLLPVLGWVRGDGARGVCDHAQRAHCSGRGGFGCDS